MTHSSENTLRLWPGLAGALIILYARLMPEALVPGDEVTGVLIVLAGVAIVMLWWLFFSRASWPERIGALLLIPLAAFLTMLFVHPSISGELGGAMLLTFLLPATLPTSMVAAACLFRRAPRLLRAAAIAVAILLGSGVWALARTEGVSGGVAPQVRWRWEPTAEERLLTAARDEKLPAPPPAATTTTPVETPPTPNERVEPTRANAPVAAPVLWSGFRVTERNAIGALAGIRIRTDWTAARPTEMWRRPVGPAWSSFAVAGDLVFTQEQRGEHEAIAAYRLLTGEPVWRHQEATRFWEPAAGAGPRSTPAVHDGRLYALGATGILNALDAVTGARIWKRNVSEDSGAPMPEWGFAGSPLVVGDALIVAASGRLISYDLASGAPRWTRKTTGGGYSSPHVATIAGVPQILLMNGSGITSVDLDGTILWDNHVEDGTGILQPAVLEDGSVIVALGENLRGSGLRRLAVSRAADGAWTVTERWNSRGLKPYFSDFVVHGGHAYGFDGTIMSAVNIDTGERVWKGGRYGAGQVLLLSQQGLLLVASEEGDVVLVAATPEKHTEITRFKAIEGKTWNHPVVVGDVLLVRNAEEMAAFRLPR